MAKIKPILFNTEMVRAILDGRKTQTRRKIPIPSYRYFMHEPPSGIIPPYEEGDMLWVRETWDNIPVSPEGHFGMGGRYYYEADGDLRPGAWKTREWKPSIHMPPTAARIFLFVKDVRIERLNEISQGDAIKEGALSSNLCETSAYKEALERSKKEGTKPPLGYSPKERFAAVWDSTIKKGELAKYGWNANPWVWAIEFERCDKDVCALKLIHNEEK